jgi:hypothetical protein
MKDRSACLGAFEGVFDKIVIGLCPVFNFRMNP